MKKKILLLMGVFSLGLLQAQVGVNTTNPQGWFHVDGQGDTNGITNTVDDVIISNDGKVGLGTVSPTTSLDIQGSIRIADGSQSAGYMLQTDDDGNGTWVPQKMRSVIFGNEDVDATLSSFRTFQRAVPLYSGLSITLPKGAWQITFSATYINTIDHPFNLWWDLSYNNTSLSWFGRVLSTSVPQKSAASPGTELYVPVTAVYFAEHTTTTTYYIWGTAYSSYFPEVPTTLGYAGFGVFWAMPLK